MIINHTPDKWKSYKPKEHDLPSILGKVSVKRVNFPKPKGKRQRNKWYRFRKRYGLPIKKTAREMGISDNTLRKFERGGSVYKSTVKKILSYYKKIYEESS